jgi:iron complex outermembrane receptor protein
MKEFTRFPDICNSWARCAGITGLLIAGIVAPQAPVFAQAEESTSEFVLEEVLVTATKRETSLMDTAISISAFSSERLQELGIDDLNDLSVNTPGLSITGGERITIRGLGIDSLALGIDPSVASYIDGYYTRGVGPFVINNFYDVERIEVLRGPQGTLYGRNTAGGAINIISKKPTQDFEGEVNLELGNEDYSAIQGMLNIPLGDRFAWRVSLSQIDRGALQENDAGPDIDELDDRTIDTTLRANWSDTWHTDLRIFSHERGGRPSGRYQLAPYETATRVFPGGITINHTYGWTQDNPAALDPDRTSQDFANYLDEDFDLAVLTNVFTVGDIDIKYIGGFSDFLRSSGTDVDWSSSTVSSSVNNIISDSEQTTHELQFISNFDGKMNFVAGMFYFESDERLYFDFQNAVDPIYSTSLDWASEFVTLALYSPTYGPRFPLATLPGAAMSEFVLGGFGFPDFQGDPNNRVFWFDTNLDSTSYAGFGQIDYDISEQLKLTFGARYSADEKKGHEVVWAIVPMSEDYGPIPIGDINGDGILDYGIIESETHKAIGNSIAYPLNTGDIAQEEKDWDNVSGLLSLEYTTDSGGLLYGSISTGYRSGGFNLGTTDAGVDSFDEETVTSYEFGYKGSMRDDSLLFEVSAYFYDYSDLQVVQSFLDPQTGAQGNEFTNAAEAEVKGLEAQFTWLASERFRLSGSYAYNNAEYTDFMTIDRATLDQRTVDFSGNKLNRAPENKVALAASYLVPMGQRGNLTFSGAYTWLDEMYTNPGNSVNGMLDSWNRIDARVTWNAASGKTAVTAFIKNLSDDREATDASGGTIADGFLRTEHLSNPRMYGLQWNYSF